MTTEDIRYRIRVDDSQFQNDLASLRANLNANLGASYGGPAIGNAPAVQGPGFFGTVNSAGSMVLNDLTYAARSVGGVTLGAGALMLQDLSYGMNTLRGFTPTPGAGMPYLMPQFMQSGGIGVPMQQPMQMPGVGEQLYRNFFSGIGLGNVFGRTSAPWQSQAEFERLSGVATHNLGSRALTSAGLGLLNFGADTAGWMGGGAIGSSLGAGAAGALGLTGVGATILGGAAYVAGGIGGAAIVGGLINKFVVDPLAQQISNRRAIEENMAIHGMRLFGKNISAERGTQISEQAIGGNAELFFGQFGEEGRIPYQLQREAGAVISQGLNSGIFTGVGENDIGQRMKEFIQTVGDLIKGLRLTTEEATQFAIQVKSAGFNLDSFSRSATAASQAGVQAPAISAAAGIVGARAAELTESQQNRQVVQMLDSLRKSSEAISLGLTPGRSAAILGRQYGVPSEAGTTVAAQQVYQNFRQTPMGQAIDIAAAGFMMGGASYADAINMVNQKGLESGFSAFTSGRDRMGILRAEGMLDMAQQERVTRFPTAAIDVIAKSYGLDVSQMDQAQMRGFMNRFLGTTNEAEREELTRTIVNQRIQGVGAVSKYMTVDSYVNKFKTLGDRDELIRAQTNGALTNEEMAIFKKMNVPAMSYLFGLIGGKVDPFIGGRIFEDSEFGKSLRNTLSGAANITEAELMAMSRKLGPINFQRLNNAYHTFFGKEADSMDSSVIEAMKMGIGARSGSGFNPLDDKASRAIADSIVSSGERTLTVLRSIDENLKKYLDINKISVPNEAARKNFDAHNDPHTYVNNQNSYGARR